MAWVNGKRTVYCRNCGNKGHNSRTCPSLTPEQKEAVKVSLSKRSCSWCHEENHDVRHCQSKAKAMETWCRLNADLRRDYFNTLNERGMTPGALVIVDNGGENSEGKLYTSLPPAEIPSKYVLMVNSIEWDQILSDQIPAPAGLSWRRKDRQRRKLCKTNAVWCKAITDDSDSDAYDYYRTTSTMATPYPEEYSWRGQIKVILPGPPLVWENMPESWRNGISGTEKLWKPSK